MRSGKVRWIFTGPATHDMITVPLDLDAGTLVASSGLEALASALPASGDLVRAGGRR